MWIAELKVLETRALKTRPEQKSLELLRIDIQPNKILIAITDVPSLQSLPLVLTWVTVTASLHH